MGEDKGSALSAPVKEQNTTTRGVQHTTDSTSTLATPSIAIPKPKLPLPAISTPTTLKDTPREWNNSKLGLRIGVDALSAGCASALVAPIITMIDRGIIENASGRNTLGTSLRNSAIELLSRPHRFIVSKPFALVFTLYFGTYFTANSIDTAATTLSSPSSPEGKKASLGEQTSGTPKFLATSTTNLALCLYKDAQFSRLFAAPGFSPRPVPLPTFFLFTVRDCLTIFASFNLPPLLAPHLEKRMSEEGKRWVGSLSVSQFVTPAAVQIVSTPLHLLGLDLYNRPGGKVKWVGGEGRVGRVMRDWGKSAVARICRIVPAFGVGGVVNTKVRKGMMGRLET